MNNNSTHPGILCIVLALCPSLGLWGCADGGELFAGTNAALVESVGLDCGDKTEGSEITISDSAACSEAVCLSMDTVSHCSCRCSGEEGDGPYCACPSGFSCHDELIANLGVQEFYAGGYCVMDE